MVALLTHPLMVMILLPLLATLTAALIRHDRLREAMQVIIAIGLFSYVFSLYGDVLAGNVKTLTLWDIMPGLSITLSLTPLGYVFAMIASGLWAVTSLYASGYMHSAGEKKLRRFFIFFSLSIAITMALALSDNLLTLFLFYEMLSLATYPLVTHKGNADARRSGRIYLGMLLSTSILFFLPAIIGTYYVAGTLDFTSGGILAGTASPAMLSVLLFLFVYGIGKTALMPMHAWLPAAMVAPTPVSALLHAVAVVKAGVFALVKVVGFIFGVDVLSELASISFWHGEWVEYMAGFTIIMASIIALQQDSLKKRLAYSTIAQLSYIILALSLFTPYGIKAAMIHLAGHAVGKITLFYAAGSIYSASKKTLVSQLGGIGRTMPWTMGAFSVGAMSMIGIPLVVGFESKYAIIEASLRADDFFIIAVLIGSTMLNAAYFLPIIIEGFFGDAPKKLPKGVKKKHGETTKRQIIAMMITSALTLFLFFHPEELLELIKVGL